MRWSEKAMAPHSTPLAWKIPWMEEPGRLQSMGSLGVRHDWVTSLSLFTFMHWRRKWQPTPVFLPGESHGRGAWRAIVHGVVKSWTRLSDFTFFISFYYVPGLFGLFGVSSVILNFFIFIFMSLSLHDWCSPFFPGDSLESSCTFFPD